MEAPVVAPRKIRKRFDTSPTPDAPRGRSPITGAPVPPGRPKGIPNKITQSLREAVELACKPGACHPQGLTGWLVERAQGSLGDRQIFASVVSKVIPAHLQHKVEGGVVVQLGWLQGRALGSMPGTVRAQPEAIDAQVVEVHMEKNGDLRVEDPQQAAATVTDAINKEQADPPPPIEPTGGGG